MFCAADFAFMLDLCTPAGDAIYLCPGMLAHLDIMLAKVWSSLVGVAAHGCMHSSTTVSRWNYACMQVMQSQLHPDWQSDDIKVFKLRLPQLGL